MTPTSLLHVMQKPDERVCFGLIKLKTAIRHLTVIQIIIGLLLLYKLYDVYRSGKGRDEELGVIAMSCGIWISVCCLLLVALCTHLYLLVLPHFVACLPLLSVLAVMVHNAWHYAGTSAEFKINTGVCVVIVTVSLWLDFRFLAYLRRLKADERMGLPTTTMQKN